MSRRLGLLLAGVAVLVIAPGATPIALSAVAPPPPTVSVDPPYQVGLGTSVRVGLPRGGAWGTPTAALGDSSGNPISSTSVPMPFSASTNDRRFFYSGNLPLTAPDAVCGENSIIVTLHPQGGPENLAPVPYHVYCPSITADPPRVTVADQPTPVTVTFTDFDPDNDSSLPKTLLLDGTTAGTFTFGEPVTFTAAAPCGAHTIELTQPAATGATLDATTPYTVYCPTLSADPNPVERGNSIAVTASGFRPGLPVQFSVLGTPVVTATPDPSGAVTIAVDGGLLRCGNDPIVARQPDTGPPPGDPALTLTAATTERVTCHAAQVSVSPGVLQLDTTALIVGSGFRPSASLVMRWRWTDGSTTTVQAAPATSDAAGKIDFSTLLFSLERLGPRTLVVSDGLHTARASALVDPSSMQPSGGPGLTMRH